MPFRVRLLWSSGTDAGRLPPLARRPPPRAAIVGTKCRAPHGGDWVLLSGAVRELRRSFRRVMRVMRVVLYISAVPVHKCACSLPPPPLHTAYINVCTDPGWSKYFVVRIQCVFNKILTVKIFKMARVRVRVNGDLSAMLRARHGGAPGRRMPRRAGRRRGGMTAPAGRGGAEPGMAVAGAVGGTVASRRPIQSFAAVTGGSMPHMSGITDPAQLAQIAAQALRDGETHYGSTLRGVLQGSKAGRRRSELRQHQFAWREEHRAMRAEVGTLEKDIAGCMSRVAATGLTAPQDELRLSRERFDKNHRASMISQLQSIRALVKRTVKEFSALSNDYPAGTSHSEGDGMMDAEAGYYESGLHPFRGFSAHDMVAKSLELELDESQKQFHSARTAVFRQLRDDTGAGDNAARGIAANVCKGDRHSTRRGGRSQESCLSPTKASGRGFLKSQLVPCLM